MSSDYQLNFKIPQGPTGPTGPIGPSNFDRAFGYLYNKERIDSIFLPNNQAVQVAFPIRSLKSNIFYPNINTIGFLSAGAYLVSYSILLQVPTANETDPITITTKLRLNNNIDDNNALVITIKNNSSYYLTNSAIINAQINDTLDIIMFADKTPDYSYDRAFLYAIKIADIATS